MKLIALKIHESLWDDFHKHLMGRPMLDSAFWEVKKLVIPA